MISPTTRGGENRVRAWQTPAGRIFKGRLGCDIRMTQSTSIISVSGDRPWLFPPEIFEEIIDQIHETSALLRTSLVSRRALVKCRHRLFSSIEIGKTGTDYKGLDRFLYLVSAKWTSLTPVVKEIHLRDLEHHNDYSYKGIKNPKLVASNLCNVKTLSLSSSTRLHGFKKILPRPVLNVIFSLNIHDLQLDTIGMFETDDIVAFFSQVPPSVKTFTFLRLGFWWDLTPNLSRHSSIFPRIFRFRRLDNTSLALLQPILDLLTDPGLDIAVESFHIRSHVPDAFYQLTQRFLHHVGPSIEQLWVKFYTKYHGIPGQCVCFCIEYMSSYSQQMNQYLVWEQINSLTVPIFGWSTLHFMELQAFHCRSPLLYQQYGPCCLPCPRRILYRNFGLGSGLWD